MSLSCEPTVRSQTQFDKLLAYHSEVEKGDSPIEKIGGLMQDTSQQLNSCMAESHRLQHDIDSLLQIHDRLNANGLQKLSPRVKIFVAELKEQGLDLLPEESAEITKEKAAELKSLIHCLLDQKRSKLQILFINKIKPLFEKKEELDKVQRAWKTLKDKIRDNIRLHPIIIGHAAGRCKDITGGLARVAELFEGTQKEGAVKIAPIDGRVDFRY